MASYQTHVGTLRSPNAVGSLAYSGVGFRPKGILIWSINGALDPMHPPGAPSSENFNYWSFSLSDGVTSIAQTSISFDGSNPSVVNQGADTGALILAQASTGGVQHRATLASFDSDGFTLNWTTVFGGERRYYGYLAIGGDEVSCKVGAFASRTTAGGQAIPAVGFRPGGVLLLPMANTAASAATLARPAIGVTDGVRQGASCVFSRAAANPTSTRRYQRTDRCVAFLNVANGALLGEAAITSFDPTGFTLNWTTAAAAAWQIYYLAFAGIPFQVGALTQPSTNGPQTTALPFRGGAVLLQSVNAAAATTVQTENAFSFGVGALGAAHAVWCADQDAVVGVRAARGQFSEAAYFAATITGPNTNVFAAKAALAGVTAESFTLNWTSDGVARELIYAAWGGTPLPGDEPVYDMTVGEVDLNPLLSTFTIQETIDAPDTLIADAESIGAPFFRPTIGQSVFVAENGVRVFGGSVTGVRERGFSGPNGDDLVVEIQATSYEQNAARRVITASFSQGAAADTIGGAFAALVSQYYAAIGVSLHPSQVAGPALPASTFQRTRGDEVNKTLAASVGYLQAIDFQNRLRAWAPGDVRAPADYDEAVNPELLTGDIAVDRQLQNGYANRVILEGDPITMPDHRDNFTGDGVTSTFPVTYAVAGPFPYFPGGAVAFGYVWYTADNTIESIGGVDAPPDFQWTYDPIAQTIHRRAGPVAAGVHFYFPYHGLFTPSGMAEDAAEIALYGLWEHVEVVTAVTTDLSAQGYADALLAEKLASKEEIVTLQTRALGFHPGQMMTIVSASRQLSGDYLITQVDTMAEDAARLVRSITAAKSHNNAHDFRRVYQQWAGVSAGASPSGSSGSGGGTGTGLHAASHEAGGIDPIQLDDLAPPSDNTDLNATTAAHGLLRKLSGSDLQVLRGDGTWGMSPLTSGVFAYTFTTATTAPPGSQRIRFNAAHPYTGATKLWADFSSSNSEDLYWGWMRIRVGSLVLIQDKDNHLQFAEFITTGVPIDLGTYVELPVAWVSNGTALAVQAVLVRVTAPAPGGGGSSGNVTASSAFGSEPGSPSVGDLVLYNNSFYWSRYSGAAWVPWGPIYPMTVPVSSDFAWLNQGSSSIEITRGGVHLVGVGTGSAAFNLVGRVKGVTPPYVITAYLRPMLVLKRWLGYALFFRQSSDGKMAAIVVGANAAGADKQSPPSLRSVKLTSATVFSLDYPAEVSIARPPNWIRLVDDNTNRAIYISDDGEHWQLFHSIGRTDFLTADQVGWGAVTQNLTTPNANVDVTLLSWKQT